MLILHPSTPAIPPASGHPGRCAAMRLGRGAASRPGCRSRSLLVCGVANQALDLLPDESVQTVVTSPPYWSLRDYDVEEQIGRDDDLADYVESIVKTFEKMKRVVRHDETVWLNVGDSYTSGNRRYRAPDKKIGPAKTRSRTIASSRWSSPLHHVPENSSLGHLQSIASD